MEQCEFCGRTVLANSLYCNMCGHKVEVQPDELKIPKVMTVKQALELFFQGTVSQNHLYQAIRKKKIPHVKVMDKILLDRDELIIWWGEQLEQSKKPLTGLRKIM